MPVFFPRLQNVLKLFDDEDSSARSEKSLFSEMHFSVKSNGAKKLCAQRLRTLMWNNGHILSRYVLYISPAQQQQQQQHSPAWWMASESSFRASDFFLSCPSGNSCTCNCLEVRPCIRSHLRETVNLPKIMDARTISSRVCLLIQAYNRISL